MYKTIKDYNIKGKKVIIRCDFNIPIENGTIKDDTRIKKSLRTIRYARKEGAKIILLSHLGRIKTEEDKEKYTLKPVAETLSKLLRKKVTFFDKTRGKEIEDYINNMKERDVVLLENTRFEDLDGKKESKNDKKLGKYWASLGDIFINDAYGTCHRDHASNVGISKLLPNGIGFLVLEEVSKLDSIMNEDSHPFVVIMGGAKVTDKIKVISNLITKCDKLIIGGGMAYTFLKSKGYNIGNSLLDSESIDFCKDIINKYDEKIVLPVDSLVSKSIDSNEYRVCDIDNIRDDEMGLDIGPKSIKLFTDNLTGAKRVIINGPLGLFENDNYSNGTKTIFDYIVSNNIKCLVGGGDSLSAVNKLSDPQKFYHVSTGGGATLEYLEGKILPGIGAIDEK